jgi:hypothetical protein
MFTNTTQPSSTQAVRLIFEYEGDQAHLVSQQPVEMLLTDIDSTRELQAGYFVDTRDANNQTLARIPAHNAFETSVEVFPEQHDQPITRMEMAAPRGAFTVIVPVPDRANHVTLTRITLGRPDISLPGGFATSLAPAIPEVNDLASFPLESRH